MKWGFLCTARRLVQAVHQPNCAIQVQVYLERGRADDKGWRRQDNQQFLGDGLVQGSVVVFLATPPTRVWTHSKLSRMNEEKIGWLPSAGPSQAIPSIQPKCTQKARLKCSVSCLLVDVEKLSHFFSAMCSLLCFALCAVVVHGTCYNPGQAGRQAAATAIRSDIVPCHFVRTVVVSRMKACLADD